MSAYSQKRTLQMTEVAVFSGIFADILCRIDELRPKPTPA